MTEVCECCRCHKAPRIICTSGLWYIYCSKCAPKQGSGAIYNICGLTQEKAIAQWNELNRHRQLFQPDAKAQKPNAETELKTLDSRIECAGKRYIGIEKLKGGKL